MVEEYRERDEILSVRFMPWIIKIQEKIYNRLTVEINKMLEDKISFPSELHLENEEIDLISKIEVMSEELKIKIEKIEDLETELDLQRQLVRMAKSKAEVIAYENSDYEKKLQEVRQDKDRIKSKVDKYKEKLVSFRNKKTSGLSHQHSGSEASN